MLSRVCYVCAALAVVLFFTAHSPAQAPGQHPMAAAPGGAPAPKGGATSIGSNVDAEQADGTARKEHATAKSTVEAGETYQQGSLEVEVEKGHCDVFTVSGTLHCHGMVGTISGANGNHIAVGPGSNVAIQGTNSTVNVHPTASATITNTGQGSMTANIIGGGSVTIPPGSTATVNG